MTFYKLDSTNAVVDQTALEALQDRTRGVIYITGAKL
jgi:hypothetical protein